MDEIQNSIHESLKNGTYFKDAMEWYEFQYIYPATQRVFWLIFLLSTLAIFSLVYNIVTTVSLKNYNYHYISQIQDDTTQQSRLLSLTHKTSSKLAIAEYLLKNFIKQYETYNLDTLDTQIKYLKDNASKSLYYRFLISRQISNPNSLTVLYGKNFFVDIKDIKISFNLNQFNDSNMATASFKKVFTNRVTGEVTEKEYKAQIRFLLSELEDTLVKGKPLIFRAKEYKLYAN